MKRELLDQAGGRIDGIWELELGKKRGILINAAGFGAMGEVTDKSPRKRKSVAVPACGLRAWRMDAMIQWLVIWLTKRQKDEDDGQKPKGPSIRCTVIGGSGHGTVTITGNKKRKNLRPLYFGV